MSRVFSRLKARGASSSATNSRSTSPNPGLKRSSTMDSTSDAKSSTLVLKVVVMKVSNKAPETVGRGDNRADGCLNRLEIWQRRIVREPVIQ